MSVLKKKTMCYLGMVWPARQRSELGRFHVHGVIVNMVNQKSSTNLYIPNYLRNYIDLVRVAIDNGSGLVTKFFCVCVC